MALCQPTSVVVQSGCIDRRAGRWSPSVCVFFWCFFFFFFFGVCVCFVCGFFVCFFVVVFFGGLSLLFESRAGIMNPF